MRASPFFNDDVAHHVSPSGLVKAWRPASGHALTHYARRERQLMPQVLDPMHEVSNGGPGISIVGVKDCIYWVEFWLFGHYGGFSTHWAHVSTPPIDGGPLQQIVGKTQAGAQPAFVLIMFL
jgi:hypothetical protein